ncbi:MAG: IscS subfamily cysteine desulfurase, partial [Bdellovibrionales bacterium]|nr:IscS subfamily cysteine desulfurase [Bdellovibrionales bacterium]
VSISLKDLSSDMFALGLSGLALSSSSACTSGSPVPSHVLKALGHSDELARSTLRFGLGRLTTGKDIEIAAAKVIDMARKSREMTIN